MSISRQNIPEIAQNQSTRQFDYLLIFEHDIILHLNIWQEIGSIIDNWRLD